MWKDTYQPVTLVTQGVGWNGVGDNEHCLYWRTQYSFSCVLGKLFTLQGDPLQPNEGDFSIRITEKSSRI